MYYLVLVILVSFSGIEIFTGKRSFLWFNISYFLMTFMATFRYGQMDDYFNYYINYEHPDLYMIVDPLFGLLILAFKSISIGYPVFIALLSLVCMLLSYRFFRDECECSCLSLLLFYGFTFLNCPMSAIRQAICLALLMHIFPLLRQHKYKSYYVWVLIGSFIHLSFAVVLILPMLLKLRIYNEAYVVYLVAGLAALAFVGISIVQFIPMDRIAFYEGGEGASILFRMALRILIIIPVLMFYPEEETNGYYAKAICIIGFALYCLLSFNDLVAGRLEYYFRTFICLFAAYLLSNNTKTSRMLSHLSLLAVLHIFLWFKNIDAGIERMSYREDITAFNFPYISVFDKSELQEYSDVGTYGLE